LKLNANSTYPTCSIRFFNKDVEIDSGNIISFSAIDGVLENMTITADRNAYRTAQYSPVYCISSFTTDRLINETNTYNDSHNGYALWSGSSTPVNLTITFNDPQEITRFLVSTTPNYTSANTNYEIEFFDESDIKVADTVLVNGSGVVNKTEDIKKSFYDYELQEIDPNAVVENKIKTITVDLERTDIDGNGGVAYKFYNGETLFNPGALVSSSDDGLTAVYENVTITSSGLTIPLSGNDSGGIKTTYAVKNILPYSDSLTALTADDQNTFISTTDGTITLTFNNEQAIDKIEANVNQDHRFSRRAVSRVNLYNGDNVLLSGTYFHTSSTNNTIFVREDLFDKSTKTIFKKEIVDTKTLSIKTEDYSEETSYELDDASYEKYLLEEVTMDGELKTRTTSNDWGFPAITGTYEEKDGISALSFPTQNIFPTLNPIGAYPFTVHAIVNPGDLGGHRQVLNMRVNSARISLAAGSSFGANNPMIMYGGSSHHSGENNSLELNKWYGITWVVRGQNDHTMYINGEKITSTNHGGSHGGTNGFALGSNMSGTEDFYGYIHKVNIYNKALTDEEVKLKQNSLKLTPYVEK
jgi:hypothetical protein